MTYSLIDLDGTLHPPASLALPIATTEGGLIASVSRGCKAIRLAGGADVAITKDEMTRCPCLEFPGLRSAAAFKRYVEGEEGGRVVREAFEDTTKHGRLRGVEAKVVGRIVYMRVSASTGEAMGMNMVSKGTENILKVLKGKREGEGMKVLTLSGNGCSDKKPSAINFVKGRGKSVTAEVTIGREHVLKTLKTNPEDMARTNLYKNQIGSSVAGNLGGSNAHAANVVAGLYLATGQDPAHVVEGSMCTTVMEVTGEGDLYVSVTVPAVCVGTVGGGTELKAAKAAIESMGCKGEGGARRLAGVVAVGIMAGEISLLASLTEGTLVEAHMKLNRR